MTFTPSVLIKRLNRATELEKQGRHYEALCVLLAKEVYIPEDEPLTEEQIDQMGKEIYGS